MHAPKIPTTTSSVGPARVWSGRRARMIPAASAPTAGALRRMPSPTGPTWRISRAKTGASAIAPPKRTAKRSSVIAPSSIRVRQHEPDAVREPGEAGRLLDRCGRASASAARAARRARTRTARRRRRRPTRSGSRRGRRRCAGPATTAIWPAIDRSAIAPGQISTGTSSGVSAPNAGQPIALAQPLAAASRKNGQTSTLRSRR